MAQEFFLDEDLFSGVAKNLIFKDFFGRENGLGGIVTDKDALALSQTGGFDDQGAVARGNVSFGIFKVVKIAGFGGGDGTIVHNFFGKDLITFESGSGFGRTEGLDARSFKRIDDAGGKGVFRANDRQVDFLFHGEFQQSANIGITDSDVGSMLGGSGIAGGAIELLKLPGLRKFPGQDMFAATTSDE